MCFTQSTVFCEFKSVFKGDLILPTDSSYQDDLKRWSILAERRAGLVAFVKSEEDVSAAVKFAVKTKVEIAVKGGGHNPSGASSTDGGMVIDLSKYLNKVAVDQETKTADVDGGALWRDVDNATCPLGLATVAGTVNETGVAGLTVGGGYGYLTGRHGLTIDNLLGATVVVADGQILEASEDENQDLYFAIRGGGSNFGIVTKFKFALHPIPPVCWSGFLFYTPDKLDALARAGVKWKEEVMSVDDTALIALTQSPEDGSPLLLVNCVHLGPGEVGKKQFRPFFDVGPIMDMTSERTYSEVNGQISKIVPSGKAYYSTGAAVVDITDQMFKDILAVQAEFRSKAPQAGHFVGFELQPTKRVREVSNSQMAFSSRGPQNNVIIMASWSNEDMNKVDIAEVRKSVTGTKKAIQGDQIKLEPAYGNFEGESVLGDEKVRKLFGANYRKLQTIKAKYDPDLVFGKWFPIQPLA